MVLSWRGVDLSGAALAGASRRLSHGARVILGGPSPRARNSKPPEQHVACPAGCPTVRHDHLRPVPSSSIVVEAVPMSVRGSRAEGDGRTARQGAAGLSTARRFTRLW